ncbi:peptidoglycan editing factor PgeF [Anaerobacterium chartisolvens]|nr:peptidoglycan editing factor PgeF [Anaerobacterium chartisolvens]
MHFIKFKKLDSYSDMLVHCFTTRLGGSGGFNLGFNRGDSRERVVENYKKLADALDIDCRNMVLSGQVHDDRIYPADERDRGKGLFCESDIKGYDALMTNKRNTALVTFYADCVPIYLLDPEKKAIALVHSGWRGTVLEIASKTIDGMRNKYGCDPFDIQAVIGPSIGKCCFEVGEEVYSEFMQRLIWSSPHCKKTGLDKWHIDLQSIIKSSIVNAGVKEENICLTGVCTKCNKDLFYSYRGDEGRTGSMAAVMQLI